VVTTTRHFFKRIHLPSYFLRSILILFFHLLIYLKWFLLSDFPTKILYVFICILPHTCRMSRPSHRPWFDTRTVRGAKRSSLCAVSPVFCPFLVLSSKCTPQHHSTEHLQPLNHISYTFSPVTERSNDWKLFFLWRLSFNESISQNTAVRCNCC
jgi:hypothetical protein